MCYVADGGPVGQAAEDLLYYYVSSEVTRYKHTITDVIDKEKPRSRAVELMVAFSRSRLLQDATLFTSIAYLDRFAAARSSSRSSWTRERWTDVACACLFIASKLEEVDAPPLANIAAFFRQSRDTVVQTERDILIALNHELIVPTCDTFLQFYAMRTSASLETVLTAQFIMELGAIDGRVWRRSWPSRTARAALFVANLVRSHLRSHATLDGGDSHAVMRQACKAVVDGNVTNDYAVIMLSCPFGGSLHDITEDALEQDAACATEFVDLLHKWRREARDRRGQSSSSAPVPRGTRKKRSHSRSHSRSASEDDEEENDEPVPESGYLGCTNTTSP